MWLGRIEPVRGAAGCRHTSISFSKSTGKDLLVLCRAADPEPGVRLPDSFTCQKLLEAGTCRRQLGKVMYLIIS